MKVIILLIFSFIFLSISGNAFALTTSEIFPTSQSACGNYTSPNNLLGAVDTLYSTVTNQNLTCGILYPSASLGNVTSIDSLTFTIYANSSGNGGGTNTVDLDEAASFSNTCGATQPTFTLSNNTTTDNVSATNCTNWTSRATKTNLNNGHFMLWVRNSGNHSINWDTVSMKVNYSYVPTLTLANVVASPSAQTVTFDASGDTTFTGVNEQCTVKLFEVDTSTTSPTFLGNAFATIFLDSTNPRTTTFNQGNGNYLGQGYTTSSSAWTAKNVIAPFFSNKNITISASTTCTHQTTNADGSLSSPVIDVNTQGFNAQLGTLFDPSLNATASALQNTTIVTQGQCTTSDWICDFKQWLTGAFCLVFCPNTSYDAVEFANLKSNINNRVPFAYITTIFATDFSNTATSTAIPDFTLPFPATITILGHSTSLGNQTYAFPSNVTAAIATIRPYLNYGLYASLLGYFLYLAHSIW